MGIGVGPSLNGERLGENALTTKSQISQIGLTSPFSEAMVTVAPGVDEDAMFAELAPRYETFAEQRPAEVENLVGLGNLPQALGFFLGAIAVLALVHALVVTTLVAPIYATPPAMMSRLALAAGIGAFVVGTIAYFRRRAGAVPMVWPQA